MLNTTVKLGPGRTDRQAGGSMWQVHRGEEELWTVHEDLHARPKDMTSVVAPALSPGKCPYDFPRPKTNNLCFVYVGKSGTELSFQVCMTVCVCFLSLFMFFSAFWCLAAFNYLHTCHKIRWLLVEDNMKHDAVSAGPSMINIFRWWFYPITFQSRKACVGHNWKLLLISIILFIEISSP